VTWAALVATAYLIVIGGTPLGDESGPLLVINIGIGAVVVAAYALRVAPRPDRTDLLALTAYLAFLAACLLSQFPRQSFDTALSALALLAVFSLARRSPALAPGGAGRWLLGGIGLVLGLVFFALWAGVVLSWLAIAETPPPLLTLRFPSLIYGHGHDVAALLIICAAATVGLPGRSGRLMRGLTLALVALAVLIEGSRTAWLAVIVASLVGATAWIARRGGMQVNRRWAVIGLATVAFIGVGMVASGLATRLADTDTLAGRVALWGGSVDAWLLDPFSGLGPGSFPWALQLTDFFDSGLFSPRHPDNAFFQTLTEAGLLGVLALGLGGAAIWVGRRRPADLTAGWALVFFGVACLLTNPSDHGFLALPAVLWAAAFTRVEAGEPVRQADQQHPATIVRWATAVAGGVVMAMALIWAGVGWWHDATEPARAAEMLPTAAAVDPGQALYHRELGVLFLDDGDPAAIPELEWTVALNPSDTAAWRLLSQARLRAGELDGALAAANEAVRRQRSDAANLLTLASMTAAAGDGNGARNMVGEAVLRWPWLIGDLPGDEVVHGVSTTEALEAAIALWSETSDPPAVNWIQPSWLTGLSGRDDLLPAAADAAGNLAGSASALHAYLRCQTDAAAALLGGASAEDGTAWYWNVRYLIESGMGDFSLDTVPLGSALSADVVAAEGSGDLPTTLDNGLADRWGYGRRPLPAPDSSGLAPSGPAGLTLWMRDPVATATLTAPDSQLAVCSAVSRR
jgi:O-antigen ligase